MKKNFKVTLIVSSSAVIGEGDSDSWNRDEIATFFDPAHTYTAPGRADSFLLLPGAFKVERVESVEPLKVEVLP